MARRTRRTRDEQSRTGPEQWEPSLLTLVGVAILFSLVAALVLRSDRGQPLGLPGAYAWVSALIIAFALRLLALARYVLPPEAENGAGASAGAAARGWREGLRMLLYYLSVLAMPLWLRRRLQPRPRSAPPELPPSFAEFDAGFVDSHRFLGLGRGTRFARAAGPGYVRLQKGERIDEVVDLRRQVRQQVVEAMTRDGIELEASITVAFQIRRLRKGDQNEPPLVTPGAVPYSYDSDAVFRLSYADGVGPTSEIPWNERIHPRAAALLVAELANRRLDELFLPVPDEAVAAGGRAPSPAADRGSTGDDDNGALSPIQEITHAVRTKLRKQEMLQIFDCVSENECPVEILDVTVDYLKPSDAVISERLENWHGAWRRLRARPEEDGVPRPEVNQVRTEAMMQIVEHVMRDLEDLEQTRQDLLCDELLNNVTWLMDRLVADGSPDDMPQHNRDALEDASLWLKDLPEQDGGQ